MNATVVPPEGPKLTEEWPGPKLRRLDQNMGSCMSSDRWGVAPLLMSIDSWILSLVMSVVLHDHTLRSWMRVVVVMRHVGQRGLDRLWGN